MCLSHSAQNAVQEEKTFRPPDGSSNALTFTVVLLFFTSQHLPRVEFPKRTSPHVYHMLGSRLTLKNSLIHLTHFSPKFYRGSKKSRILSALSTSVTFVSPLFRISAVYLKSKINLSCIDDSPVFFPSLVSICPVNSENELRSCQIFTRTYRTSSKCYVNNVYTCIRKSIVTQQQ